MTCTKAAFSNDKDAVFSARAGIRAVLLNSDGELAKKAIVYDYHHGEREVQTIKEESHQASSDPNSVVERAIQSVQGMLRVMKCAMQARRRKGIRDEHPALAWVADCAAVLLNRFEVKGKKAKLSGVWEDGIFLGARSVTTRTVQRRTEAERWEPEAADLTGESNGTRR